MSNTARFRAFSNTLFSKTAWIATVALVASLLVVVPVSQTAAEATEVVIAPDSISVGYEHACAVVDGGVKCWGSNRDGQLGVAGIAASATAVQAIAAGSNVVQVSAGGYHSCALFLFGAIKCWGDNQGGQLGTGNSFDTHQASNVVIRDNSNDLIALSGATQISAGAYHSCAVVGTGGVKCWGDNWNGQLGTGNEDGLGQTSALDVVDSTGLVTGATQVSAGYNHTCAVVDRGVACWGANGNGQLGTGNTDGTFQASSVVVRNESGLLVSLSNSSQVSAGWDHTCAVVATGIKCWGLNEDGQLGDGTSSTKEVATDVAFVENASQVSAGRDHSCAVVATGVKCWGSNDLGQLGNGRYTESANAVEAIAAGNSVFSIGTGESFSCALLASEISCWGGNWAGQLGNGDVLSQETPAAVGGLEGATALAASDGFSCALMADTQVKCWGDNSHGQLGNGAFAYRFTPVLVDGLTGATAISTGDDHACAIVANGAVKCWGLNEDGQLGNGSFTDSLTPSSVLTGPGTALTGATKITAGSKHTCAIVVGNVKCWGYNDYWKQIDTSGDNLEFATEVVGLPSGTALDVTANHPTTCVVVSGRVVCLGGNLGSGTTRDLGRQHEFVELSATAASLGDGFLCVLIADGQVSCLGDNSEGQTGVASPSDYFSNDDDVSSPTTMSVFRGQIAIDAGDSHVCSLSASGAVSCWGSNEVGQLGRFVEGDSTHIPALVAGLSSGVTVLAAGDFHTCAIVASEVKCWGSNVDGALGLVRISESSTPIPAAGVFSGAIVVIPPTIIVTAPEVVLAKPELAKANRIAVLKTGQRITLTGTNLSNVKSVMVGSKDAKILSSSGSEIVIEVPANLFGSPQVTLVSSSGIQTIDGLIQIVQPYVARSVKISAFKGNELTKASALAIRKSYLRDSSVNKVSCAAVFGKGASARAKSVAIAKARSACVAVSSYSVKFSEFKIALSALKTPLKTPYVTVTFSRSTPTLVK